MRRSPMQQEGFLLDVCSAASRRITHHLGKPLVGRFLQSTFAAEERNYSDKTAEEIDVEVHRLIDESHERSRNMLQDRQLQLKRIASELIQKETLDRTALDELLHSTEPEKGMAEVYRTQARFRTW